MYMTPELLTLGSAKDLVLGSETGVNICRVIDNATGQSWIDELW